MAKISPIVVGKLGNSWAIACVSRLDMENFFSFLARIPLMQRSQKERTIMRYWVAILMVSVFYPATAFSVVWPQSESVYQSQTRTPQWIESPPLQNVQRMPPVPTTNAPVGPYGGNYAAPVSPNYGGYPGYAPTPYSSYGYPSYGYPYPYPYLGYGYYDYYPRRSRDVWDRLPFIGRDGGDWGSWDMPSFDMPSMSFPSFGW